MRSEMKTGRKELLSPAACTERCAGEGLAEKKERL
jgi:hypothetical protein